MNIQSFFSIDDNIIEKSFLLISDRLLKEYDLVVNENRYELFDIEFYYHSKNHLDGYTLDKPITPLGGFRPHRYGIDISLCSGKSYGGILIKGIRFNNELIYKSNKVKNYFLQCIHYGSNHIEFQSKSNSDDIKYFRTVRNNLGKINKSKNKTKEYQSKLYRFIRHDTDYYKLMDNKINTMDNSTLSKEEIKQLRGW